MTFPHETFYKSSIYIIILTFDCMTGAALTRSPPVDLGT